MTAHFETIIGRYMHLDLFGRKHRIYVEEAGQGTRCCVCTPPAPTGVNIAR